MVIVALGRIRAGAAGKDRGVRGIECDGCGEVGDTVVVILRRPIGDAAIVEADAILGIEFYRFAVVGNRMRIIALDRPGIAAGGISRIAG
jgi:hypothetical protein